MKLQKFSLLNEEEGGFTYQLFKVINFFYFVVLVKPKIKKSSQ